MAGVVFAAIFTVGLISLMVITIHKSLMQVDKKTKKNALIVLLALPIVIAIMVVVMFGLLWMSVVR